MVCSEPWTGFQRLQKGTEVSAEASVRLLPTGGAPSDAAAAFDVVGIDLRLALPGVQV